MNLVRRYWFGSFISLLLLCFIGVFVLVLLAPKQDVEKRGFIPCTENMVDGLFGCNKGIWCSIKIIVNNNVCVLGVIGNGFANWMKNKQTTPWSNYIFEPKLYPSGFVDEEARKEYLKEYPDTIAEMKRLHRLRKDIEDENNKQIKFESNWQQEE